MNIENFKNLIETNNLDDRFYILVSLDTFTPLQYLKSLSKSKNISLEYLDDPESTLNTSINVLFNDNSVSRLSFWVSENTTELDSRFKSSNNTYLISKKVSKKIVDEFGDQVVFFPKLEDWMIRDYVYTKCKGVDQKKLDYLVSNCSDMFQIDNEIQKILSFKEADRDKEFDNIKELLPRKNDNLIFDISNAIVKKDISEFKNIIQHYNILDVEPMALYAILYKQFRLITMIQLDGKATPQSCGISDKQFYAIKKYTCGKYSSIELRDILEFLSGFDLKLKTGEISNIDLLDYFVIKTIGVSR